MEPSGRDAAAPRSWTLRVIAPVALVATALVAILIVRAAVDDSGEQPSSTQHTATSTTATGCDGQVAAQAVENGYYVLQAGESLGSVAERTCVPLEQIEELNPNLDPQSLPVGGCVDLVVDGCKALAQG